MPIVSRAWKASRTLTSVARKMGLGKPPYSIERRKMTDAHTITWAVTVRAKNREERDLLDAIGRHLADRHGISYKSTHYSEPNRIVLNFYHGRGR